MGKFYNRNLENKEKKKVKNKRKKKNCRVFKTNVGTCYITLW